jgi:hypothetical protein
MNPSFSKLIYGGEIEKFVEQLTDTSSIQIDIAIKHLLFFNNHPFQNLDPYNNPLEL